VGVTSATLASELLTIDVDAEIRKLCGRQFRTPAEQMVELVRVAIHAGAKVVRIELGIRWATIETEGGHLSESTLHWLCAIADPRLSSQQRHEALTQCEVDLGAGLLSLVSSPAASVTSSSPECSHIVEFASGRSPRHTRASGEAPALQLRVARQGSRREERAALRRACRFSRVPVFLAGQPLGGTDQLEDCLLQTEVSRGNLSCRVGLPRVGELCHTVILCQELVVKETYGLSRYGYVYAALVRDRRAIRLDQINLASAKSLVDRARSQLYRRLRSDYSLLSRADRVVARDLLFRRSERSRDTSVLAGVPLFRRLAGRPVSLAKLARSAQAGAIWAVAPEMARRRWLANPRTVYLLDAREREYLTTNVRIVCQQPPAVGRESWRMRVRVLLGRFRRRISWRLSHVTVRLLGGQPLRPTSLTDEEKMLVAAIQNEIRSGRFSLPGVSAAMSTRVYVGMAERGGLPLALRRYRRRLGVLLPRHHPVVRRMVDAFAVDGTSLQPILAALFGGHDGYGRHKSTLHHGVLGFHAARH
jgi:hypothetical protein